jgi:hypothetical protein
MFRVSGTLLWSFAMSSMGSKSFASGNLLQKESFDWLEITLGG